MKKVVQYLMMGFILIALWSGITGIQVNAASSDLLPEVNGSCYIKGYCYRVDEISGKKVNVFADEACSQRNKNEYISAGTDENYIFVVSRNYNNIKVSYPTSRGRKKRWTFLSRFTSATSCTIKYAKVRILTYKFASTKYSYGSISASDKVWVYETWKGYTRVVYPISGGYKFAWIKSSDAERYLESAEIRDRKTISEGIYKIATALNTQYVLDVNNYAKFNGGNVEIYPYHETANEQWRITSLGNGYYKITDTNSGKVLDVSGGGSASGTNVQIWEPNGTDAQKWYFLDAGNGYYYIVNAAGCYLDVQNGTVQNANNVWVYTRNTTNAQKWKITQIKNTSNDSNGETSGHISYAAYRGVRYDNIGLSSQRVAALNKAKSMVTIQWTAPVDFPTWCSAKGVYNQVQAVDGTKSRKFIKGKTYTGIPYSMKDHTWDEKKWSENLKSLTTGKMTAKDSRNGKTTTAHGMDCSYFVYTAFKSAVPSYGLNYQTTKTMLNSRYYKQISLNQMKPGDLFLKNGHVMMYVGKNGSKYAVFEADAGDSKCSYNEYSYTTIKRYQYYRFRGFND